MKKKGNLIAIYYNVFIPLAERLKRLEQVVGLTLPKEDDFGFDVSGMITMSMSACKLRLLLP